MPLRSNQAQPEAEDLSALLDGELDAATVPRVCGAFRDDAQTRQRWHAYQLIGDVLRSDDLASTARRDAAFMAALRERLAGEPVVLAPAAAYSKPLTAASVQRWRTPVAVAAGFAAVGAALLVTRAPAPPASTLAEVPPAATVSQAQPKVQAAGAAPADPRFLREAHVDVYVRAHRQFSAASPLAISPSIVRTAADGSPDR